MRKVKKDDKVLIIAGNDRGSSGRVLKVIPVDNKVIVEGVNMKKRHTKPSQKLPQGGILEIEAPIHVSNVKVIAPKANKPTRIGIKTLKDGSKVRYCKNKDCNEEELV